MALFFVVKERIGFDGWRLWCVLLFYYCRGRKIEVSDGKFELIEIAKLEKVNGEFQSKKLINIR